MKALTRLIVCFFFGAIIFATIQANISPATAQERADLEKILGNWQGALKVPGVELRIVFKISIAEDGGLKATMDSPDQGAFDIPTSKTSFDNDSLQIAASLIGGLYQGKFNQDFSAIAGQWRQSGMTFPLVLEKTAATSQLNRPQQPQKPYPYIEEQVSYQNQLAGITLAGTLTRPDSAGKFPAVLLITGSGAQDRDEAIFGHRPFLVLADYLTRQGIAVLRVDDRGVGGSSGNMAQSTSEDFATDVLTGVNYLKARKEINPKQIGLIGHSEGGIIAPMVVAQSKAIAFIVLMAGTGLTGEEILYLQSDLIARAGGASDSVTMRNRQSQQQLFSIVKQEKEDSVATVKLRSVIKESIDQLSDAEKKALGDGEAYINAQVQQLISPWFRFFLTFDPKPILQKVTCPVLAINGELDLQVPPKENLAAIEAALKAGGNSQVTTKILPRLNHLFQTAATGLPAEYGKIEETISPVALKIIGDWIRERIAK